MCAVCAPVGRTTALCIVHTSRHHSIPGRSQPGRSELVVPLHRRRIITIIIVYSRIKFKKKNKIKIVKNLAIANVCPVLNPNPNTNLILTLSNNPNP